LCEKKQFGQESLKVPRNRSLDNTAIAVQRPANLAAGRWVGTVMII
jgi:hypothetical protein